MPTNKNQLRDDAVALAVYISELCDSMGEKNYFSEQMLHATSTMGSALCSLKNLREEISIVRRINHAIDACAELNFASRVLRAQNKLGEEDYKNLKKLIASLEKRFVSSLTEC